MIRWSRRAVRLCGNLQAMSPGAEQRSRVECIPAAIAPVVRRSIDPGNRGSRFRNAHHGLESAADRSRDAVAGPARGAAPSYGAVERDSPRKSAATCARRARRARQVTTSSQTITTSVIRSATAKVTG